MYYSDVLIGVVLIGVVQQRLKQRLKYTKLLCKVLQNTSRY